MPRCSNAALRQSIRRDRLRKVGVQDISITMLAEDREYFRKLAYDRIEAKLGNTWRRSRKLAPGERRSRGGRRRASYKTT